jgi:vacuolar-type H+-ATPase subunit H
VTDELESQRRALASEIEQLRIQRDRLEADIKPVDRDAELEAVKAQREQIRSEREQIRSERERIATATDQRIADQGRSARGDVLDLAVQTALERQRIAGHTAEQDRHLTAIDGSIDRSAAAMAALAVELGAMKEARAKETAVSEALAKVLAEQREGGLTSKRLYISVIAIVLPIVVTLVVVLVKG